jgi:thiopeptide-type bacteriocin biosynthesis protein
MVSGEEFASLDVRPNPTLFRVGDGYHYVERRIQGRAESVELSRVLHSEPLEVVLAASREGVSVGTLCTTLREFAESNDEAVDFIRELCLEGVLVSSAAVSSLRSNPMAQMLALECNPTAAKPSVLAELRSVVNEGGTSDATQFVTELVCYEAALRTALVAQKVAADGDSVLQIDGWNDNRSEIPECVVRAILAVLPAYHRASVREEDPLTKFISRFFDRYERAEVPFLEAVDELVGLGEYLKEVDTSPASAPPLTSPISDLILRRIGDVLAGRCDEVRIEPAELHSIDDPVRALPASLCVLFSLVSSGEGAAPRPFIHGIRGATGAHMLGRVGDLAPEVESLMREIAQREAQHVGSAVVAEVDFLPPGRHGNVALRPAHRAYRIDLSGTATPDGVLDIPLSDLSLSVTPGGRLRLRSATLAREVVPRITTSHNYDHARNPPIYRLLGMLQHHQQLGHVAFAAGLGAGLPYVPRITLGGIIVSRATWRLYADELKPMRSLSAEPARDAMRALLARRGIPAECLLADGDNMLPVRVDDDDLLDALIGEVRRRTYCALVEPLHADGFRADGSSSAHEFVLPAVLREPRPVSPDIPVSWPLRMPARRMDLGDDWTTCYLYLPEAATDSVLASDILPCMDALYEASVIDGWFFVRYGDPDWHLRLRVRPKSASLGGPTTNAVIALLKGLTTSGRVLTYRFVPYLRELERYGGDDLLASIEACWMSECEQVAALLARTPSLRDPNRRIAWCALQMCHLAGAVLVPSEVADLLHAARDQMNARLPRAVNQSAYESACFKALRAGVGGATTREALERWLDVPPVESRRQDRRRAALGRLRELVSIRSASERKAIMGSVVHMLANHHLGKSGGREEFAAYGIACRALRAEWALEGRRESVSAG